MIKRKRIDNPIMYVLEDRLHSKAGSKVWNKLYSLLFNEVQRELDFILAREMWYD
jgi:hypothetical protein